MKTFNRSASARLLPTTTFRKQYFNRRDDCLMMAPM